MSEPANREDHSRSGDGAEPAVLRRARSALIAGSDLHELLTALSAELTDHDDQRAMEHKGAVLAVALHDLEEAVLGRFIDTVGDAVTCLLTCAADLIDGTRACARLSLSRRDDAFDLLDRARRLAREGRHEAQGLRRSGEAELLGSARLMQLAVSVWQKAGETCADCGDRALGSRRICTYDEEDAAIRYVEGTGEEWCLAPPGLR